MSEQARLQKRARGQRPQYFADPSIDRVLSITMALAGEVAVMRDRMDSMERLLQETGALDLEKLNGYRPSPEVQSEREAWRDNFLDVVLRSVHQEAEALQQKLDRAPYEGAIEDVNTN